jgi:hypothetical protein
MRESSPRADIAPWIPDENFWQGNLPAIDNIFRTFEALYPDFDPPTITSEQNEHPSEETREWMWQRLMGQQHGSQQGFGDKLPLTREMGNFFWQDLSDLHYGPYGFVDPHPAAHDVHYDKAFVLGGMPFQNTVRLLAVTSQHPQEADVDEIILMNGQRQRWDMPGESKIGDIYKTVSRLSGTDMDKLQELSPFVKEQEARVYDHTNEWDRAYPTEFELGRLSMEAVLVELIDWDEYPVWEAVDEDSALVSYVKDGKTLYVPPRGLKSVSYKLKDGRTAHVLNGKAVERSRGYFPRPTSDSAVREAMDLFEIEPGDSLVISSNAPHVRAAIDTLIRILDQQGDIISRADIASGPWDPSYEVLAGLGEIPATYKADMRLRAVVSGNNPDTELLTAL